MDAKELGAEVSRIKWFHRIDLGNGVVTPGVDDTPRKLPTLHFPDDLRGKTVLDIGAWDGFFSFEAEGRGASRVLATDSFSWNGEGWGSKAGFELARRALGSKVDDMEIEVLDLSPSSVGSFDLVLFLGVLYHMRYPLLALDKLASVTRGMAIIETVVDKVWDRRPTMAFYPGSELTNDPTNWWGPNPAAVEAMLKSAGFRQVSRFGPFCSGPHTLAAAVKRKLSDHDSFFARLQQNRMVFHAWR